jgi:hypothetical protein
MNNLELFFDNLNNSIDCEDLNKFVELIKLCDKNKKCLVSKYKLDKFIIHLDKYIKIEKCSGVQNKIYKMVPICIIYFMIFNDYIVPVSNFLKNNPFYIECFIEDIDKNDNYELLELIIKKEYDNILILLINGMIKNIILFARIHSIYSKKYNEFEKIIMKMFKGENNEILYSLISMEYNKKYNENTILLFKNYICNYCWLVQKNSEIIDIIGIVMYILEFLNKNNLIDDDLKLLTLKKNKLINNYYIFNDVIDLFYFYGIKITNDNYANLVENNLNISNCQRFGIKMNNITMVFLLNKNIIPTIIEEIPNNITMSSLFSLTNLNKKNIINFINYGGIITSECFKSFVSKYDCIEKYKEASIIENVIIQYYNIKKDDFINYEKKMSKKTGILYLLNEKENNIINSKNKINIPNVEIIINENKLKKFKEKICNKTQTLYEYFLEYIEINNLKIYNYVMTNNVLSKLFNVQVSCLLDIDKIKILFA